MLKLFEIFKVILLGIVEGITEWLPISSTGHLLLVDEFLKINIGPNPETFARIFVDVIQLGAILAVVVVFFKKMWPFGKGNTESPLIKKDIFSMWFKVVFACVPGLIATVLFKDFIDEYLNSAYVIALALIAYGIAFIIIENRNKGKSFEVTTLDAITYKHALFIGLYQVLSIIPGTSRSGSTIIGGLLCGVSRTAAAEFTFFLAVPVMMGLSALEMLEYILDYGIALEEIIMLGIGMAVAFLVSLFVIKFLMSYIRKHDFKVFGWYRIALGILILLFYGIKALIA